MNTCEQTLKEIKVRIEMFSERKTLSDLDTDVYDASGGNYDDAYASGVADGYTYFARDLKRLVE